MKNVTFRQVAFAFLVTLISLAASATAFGATVDVTTLMSNAGFELGCSQPHRVIWGSDVRQGGHVSAVRSRGRQPIWLRLPSTLRVRTA